MAAGMVGKPTGELRPGQRQLGVSWKGGGASLEVLRWGQEHICACRSHTVCSRQLGHREHAGVAANWRQGGASTSGGGR